jgi:hypothetical protein
MQGKIEKFEKKSGIGILLGIGTGKRLAKKCTPWTENYPRSAPPGPRLNFIQEVHPLDFSVSYNY